MTWRMVAAGQIDAPERPGPSQSGGDSELGEVRLFGVVTSAWAQAAMVDLDCMNENEPVSGPALLVAVDTTVVVPNGYTATMAAGGYVVIEVN